MRNRTKRQQIKTVSKVENKSQIPLQQNQGDSNSFMSNMMSGFSLGMGQSIAFNTVNAIFGNGKPLVNSNPLEEPSSKRNIEDLYKECLQDNSLEHDKCEYIKRKLTESI